MTDDLIAFGVTDDYSDNVIDAFNSYGKSAEKWPTAKAIREEMRTIAHFDNLERPQEQFYLPETAESLQKRKEAGIRAVKMAKEILRHGATTET